ncbi:S49 family peptidase [Arsenicitalea aurantiaca]|uniref:S49 family peptidase n=2 Tax=Arsenicitalea aurantiaca TaxID=1783274 RepID=A0A433XBJ7_9HYPH|nr:S49 family peptidase [Arsenicitalea aurantiaca]
MGWLRRLLGRDGPIIPVVRLQGVITSDSRPGRLNIASVAPLLARAFAINRAPVVAIIVNSPGGSPVQSRLISKRIRDLADEKGRKVIVFVEDAAASGGYFIAVAGDEIIADPSSVVGSIGVIFAGFGFVGAIDRLGVTRRVHTAGRNKSTLDPFLPEKPEDVARIKAVELDIHQTFIDHVKARRGDRLRADDDHLFTGEWWTGRRGVELGLVDATGDLYEVLRERYGTNLRFKLIEPKRPLFSLPRFGMSMEGVAGDAVASLEERAHWSRLGL